MLATSQFVKVSDDGPSDDAAGAGGVVRKPPVKEPAGNGRPWRAGAERYGGLRTTEVREGNRTPMSVLADDVAAHDCPSQCGNLR